ncbi:MAG: M28 family peptidase [Archangium sp.]|nr:M28 family peptidase [Archangium sp.]
MRRLVIFGVLLVCMVSLGSCVAGMVSMPGTSYAGAPVAPDEAVVVSLTNDVTHLAADIGERNIVNTPAALEQTASWITQRLTALGYEVKEQPYPVGERTVKNLVVEKKGTALASELVVVGAHYDTAPGNPGADDNGSGVASALSLAEYFAKREPQRTLRFIFFTNEEPPFFRKATMGSEVAAKKSREANEDIKAMLSLETMGYFTDAEATQHYPFPFSLFYPSKGNFIAFVADTESRELIHAAITAFRAEAKVASEGASVPASIQGVDWSDHGPYWRQGYRAIMVTDTAPNRNPNYHEQSDLPGTLDFTRLAHVTVGLRAVIETLANPK